MDAKGLTSRQRSFGWATIAVCGAAIFVFRGAASAPTPGPPGWDDLVPCFSLTSFDSKKELTLNSDFTVKLLDRSGSGSPVWHDGRWALLDAEQHAYSVDVEGGSGAYFVVSPPDSEGCLFAAGNISHVDLRRSWFSRVEDQPDPEQ